MNNSLFGKGAQCPARLPGFFESVCPLVKRLEQGLVKSLQEAASQVFSLSLVGLLLEDVVNEWCIGGDVVPSVAEAEPRQQNSV